MNISFIVCGLLCWQLVSPPELGELPPSVFIPYNTTCQAEVEAPTQVFVASEGYFSVICRNFESLPIQVKTNLGMLYCMPGESRKYLEAPQHDFNLSLSYCNKTEVFEIKVRKVEEKLMCSKGEIEKLKELAALDKAKFGYVRPETREKIAIELSRCWKKPEFRKKPGLFYLALTLLFISVFPWELVSKLSAFRRADGGRKRDQSDKEND